MDVISANEILNTANLAANTKEKETVKVVVRCRPLSTKEKNENRLPILTLNQDAAIITIKNPSNNQLKNFTFDSVYDENTSQKLFYEECGYPLVESIFEGYNGTIFAYGQTGCGKTHTMQGLPDPIELRGVIPLSFDHIFENIKLSQDTMEYMVRASYLEIYNEEIIDLLSDDTSKTRLDLKESTDGSVYVKDLTEIVVADVQSINKVMEKGFKNRTVGATLMNQGSSRSHSIFTLVVEMSEKGEGGSEKFKAGKLNLVDLAGSERQSKTGATGARLKEGCKINLSLSALGNVISALVDGKGKHIPYRDSKLTRLLQDSLGGNTKTVMVAAVSPADYNYDETLSTLRYANRAKNIKNKPIVNEDPKDAKLREYKEEIERLRKLLETQSSHQSRSMSRPFSGITDENTTNPNEINENNSISSDSKEINSTLLEEFKKRQEEEEKREKSIILATEEAKKLEERAKLMMEKAEKMILEAQNKIKEHEKEHVDKDKDKDKKINQKVIKNENKNETENVSKKEGNSENKNEKNDENEYDNDNDNEFENENENNSKELNSASIIEAELKAKEIILKAEKMMQEAKEKLILAEENAKKEKDIILSIEKEKNEKLLAKEKQLELEEYNKSILYQRDQIGKELENTHSEIKTHLLEKQKLAEQLAAIQSKILGSNLIPINNNNNNNNNENNNGNNNEITDIPLINELAKQQAEYRRTQLKLKAKKKKEAKYEAAKITLMAEKKKIQDELKSTQEIAQNNYLVLKKKNDKYKTKLNRLKEELQDLTEEYQREKDNYMDTIRDQTREIKMLEQLTELIFPPSEMLKIWEQSKWNDEKEEWKLPKIKPRTGYKNLKLPELGNSNNNKYIDSEDFDMEGGAEVIITDEQQKNQNQINNNNIVDNTTIKKEKRKKSNSNSNQYINNNDNIVIVPVIATSTLEPLIEEKEKKVKKTPKNNNNNSNNNINSTSSSTITMPSLISSNNSSVRLPLTSNSSHSNTINNNNMSNSPEKTVRRGITPPPTGDRLQSRQGSRQAGRRSSKELDTIPNFSNLSDGLGEVSPRLNYGNDPSKHKKKIKETRKERNLSSLQF